MQTEKHLYMQGISVVAKMPYLFIFVVFVSFFLEILEEYDPISKDGYLNFYLRMLSFLVFSLLAFFAHWYILNTEILDIKSKICALTLFVFRSLILVIFVSLLNLLMFPIPYFVSNFIRNQYDPPLLYILSLVLSQALIYGISIVIVLGIFGTWLPSGITRDGTGIKKAFMRGMSTFWKTARRLIIGPGLIWLIQTIIFLVIITPNNLLLNYNLNKYLSLELTSLLIKICGSLISCFITILMALVISKTYLALKNNTILN